MGQDSSRPTGGGEPPKGKYDDVIDGHLAKLLEQSLDGSLGGRGGGESVELSKARWEHEDRSMEHKIRLVEAKFGRHREDKVIDTLAKLGGVAEEVLSEVMGEDDDDGNAPSKMRTKGKVSARKDADKPWYFKCMRDGCGSNVVVAPGAAAPYVCGKCGAPHEPDVAVKTGA